MLMAARCRIAAPAIPNAPRHRCTAKSTKKLGISVPVIYCPTLSAALGGRGLTEVAVGVAGMQVFREFRNSQ